MTLITALTIREPQVRVPFSEARKALDSVTGQTASNALQQLRFGIGRTCEPIARLLERAIAEARSSGLDPHRLVVTAPTVTEGEAIVRVRRKAHGKADWITSVTSDISIDLTPQGLYGTAKSDSAQDLPVRASDSPMPEPSPAAITEQPLAVAVLERLYDVIDPDLGINIVDLGFVRGVEIDRHNEATITMTLTSPACPLTGIMADQMRTELLAEDRPPLIGGFHVEWQWVPPWKPSDISADGREQLQAIGFTI